MLIEVKVPVLPESVSEATLVNWHKKAGDAVKRDENLIDIETDKVVLELPAPDSGVLTEIGRGDGSTVTAQEVIAVIDTEAQAAAPAGAAAATPAPRGCCRSRSTAPAPAPRDCDQPQRAPAAAPGGGRVAGRAQDDGRAGPERGGCGGHRPRRPHHQGRRGRRDAGLAGASLTSRKRAAAPAAPAARRPPAVQLPANLGARPEQRVPMSRLRQRVAERLVQSQSTAAILTTFNEVNMAPVIELRNRYKERFEKEHGVKLGFMGFFVKAAVHALKKFPMVNASIDGTDIVYHGYFDIGIAVGSPRGLVVPILRDADQMSIAEIEKQIADFGKRAQDGKLTVEELTGGTYTISNGGVFGSMLSTPIINPPQSAILGVHATKERPVVENGQVVIRPINYLAQSYDHRIIDGREAVLSLVAIKEALEDPARMLLDL